MVDLVPELKLIIGEQPPSLSFCPGTRNAVSSWCSGDLSASSPRRNIPWRCFSTTCNGSTRRHSDFEDLLTQGDVQHLMLIGAYRDNEVDPAHPLCASWERSAKAGASVHEIVLAPCL